MIIDKQMESKSWNLLREKFVGGRDSTVQKRKLSRWVSEEQQLSHKSNDLTVITRIHGRKRLYF